MTNISLSQLESNLWESANSLRGPVDAADFKFYVFPLMFFKHIFDVHNEEHVGVGLGSVSQGNRRIGKTRRTLYPAHGETEQSRAGHR